MSSTSSPFLAGIRPVALLALACFLAGGGLGAAIVGSISVSGTSSLTSDLANANERVAMLEEVLRQQATDGRYALVAGDHAQTLDAQREVPVNPDVPPEPATPDARANTPAPAEAPTDPNAHAGPASPETSDDPEMKAQATKTVRRPRASEKEPTSTPRAPGSERRSAQGAPSNDRAEREVPDRPPAEEAVKVVKAAPAATAPPKSGAASMQTRPVAAAATAAAAPPVSATAPSPKAEHVRVVAPAPAGGPERERLEAVPAAKAGVQRIEPGAVVMRSGTRVAVGEAFASGERLIATDPAKGKIVTSDRTLIIL